MTKINETKITDIIQDDRNLNRGTDEGKEMISKSLRKFGAGRSILIDKNNRIIAGNKTHENAREIGIDDVVVVETDGSKLVAVKRTDIDLDTTAGREMALADNATVKADLQWDMDEMDAIATDFDIEVEDWGIELDEDGTQENATDDDFNEEENDIPQIAKKGDIFSLGEHRLMCGDSANAADVEKLMNGQKADLVFTDPPYGVAIGDKNRALNAATTVERIERNIENDAISKDDLYPILVAAMKNCKSSCKEDASYYVTSPQVGELFMMMMMMMMEAGLPVRHVLIWVKNVPTFSLGRLDYDYQHETILYTWSKKHHNYRGGRIPYKYMELRQTEVEQTPSDHETRGTCCKLHQRWNNQRAISP